MAPNGTAILRMDGSGDLVEECAMRHLETCVPSIGKTVVVVQLDNDAKDNKNNSDDAVLMLGATGKIVEKDGERERAIVQLYADLEIREFKYDDICESAVEHNE